MARLLDCYVVGEGECPYDEMASACPSSTEANDVSYRKV